MKDDPPKSIRYTVAAYRRMLRVYPKVFRDSYGEPMTQLFREQCADARAQGTGALMKLWGHACVDLIESAAKEQLSEITRHMNRSIKTRLFAAPRLSFSKLFMMISLFLAVAFFASVALKPRIYVSNARLAVEWSIELEARRDPVDIQSELAKIGSKTVLQRVLEESKLAEHFSVREGRTVTNRESYERLKGAMLVRHVRDTRLIDLSVFDENPKMAAALANKIVDVYAEQTQGAGGPGIHIQRVDLAEPALRPIRPNVPLNVAVGSIVILLAAALSAALVRLLLRSIPTARTMAP